VLRYLLTNISMSL